MPASPVAAVVAAVEYHFHVSRVGGRRTLRDRLDMAPMGFQSSSVRILGVVLVEEAEGRSHEVDIGPVAVVVVIGGAGVGGGSAAWDSSGRKSARAEETQEPDMGTPWGYKDH